MNYGGHLEGVKGNTVALNQILTKALNAGSSNFYANGASLTYDAGIFTMLANQTNGNVTTYPRKSNNDGHKFLYVVDLLATTDGTIIRLNDNYFSLSSSAYTRCFLITTRTYVTILDTRNGNWNSIFFKNTMMQFDLTFIYGAGNEPTNVADFEADYMRWFGKPLAYEAYNPGELIAVKMAGLKSVGFNAWDEIISTKVISDITGEQYGNEGICISSLNHIPVLSNTNYYIRIVSDQYSSGLYIKEFDANKQPLSDNWSFANVRNNIITTSANAKYLKFMTLDTYGTSYNHDICINLSHSDSRNGQYEPYWDFLLNFAISNVYGKVNGEGSLVQIAANGLKKADYAGTIYDVINLKDCTADIRVSDTPATPGEGLYEPLATPLHYTDLVYRINGVDYPLEGALPYKVDDYGTEEVVAISGQKTVAPVLQLRYGINVGDTTKNLPFNYLSPKMQQTFTEDEKRQARKNIGVDATRADVLALIRANEDALLTVLKTAGTITDYTLDAEAEANGVYGVTVS